MPTLRAYRDEAAAVEDEGMTKPIFDYAKSRGTERRLCQLNPTTRHGVPANRIDHERQHERERSACGRQAEHLIVVEEKQRSERKVLVGVRERAEALIDLGRDRQRPRAHVLSMIGRGRVHEIDSSPMSNRPPRETSITRPIPLSLG